MIPLSKLARPMKCVDHTVRSGCSTHTLFFNVLINFIRKERTAKIIMNTINDNEVSFVLFVGMQ